jgi:hypothetical protein
MVGTVQPPSLSVSDTEWRRHRWKMKPLGWKNRSTCRITRRVRSLGRQAGKKPPFITWAGESENIQLQEMYFFLTSPFIELLGTWPIACYCNRRATEIRIENGGGKYT